MVQTANIAHARTRSLFSLESHLAFAPATTYALLCDEPSLALWRRLGIILLVVAVCLPIMALQRVTIAIVAATAVAWSFILAIQLVLAMLIIASVPSRQTATKRALDLWFAGNFPYTVWLLTVAALVPNLPSTSLELIIVSAIVPSAWTAAIVSAFCRVVLGTSRSGARWRAVVHFIAVWTIALEYVALNVGGWFQVTDAIVRLLG